MSASRPRNLGGDPSFSFCLWLLCTKLMDLPLVKQCWYKVVINVLRLHISARVANAD